jgi:hypothetical protein
VSQRIRIFAALVILVALCGAILGAESLRRANAGTEQLPAGSIPLCANGVLLGGISADDLASRSQSSFKDVDEGKDQAGWFLRDAILLRIPAEQLGSDTKVTVSSSSRGKNATLTWDEVAASGNKVLLATSGRGTLKLVALAGQLSARANWVQDVDRIELNNP